MKMKAIFPLAVCVFALVLAGCSSPRRCPLNARDGYCASVPEVYEAARKGGGDDQNVMAMAGAGHHNQAYKTSVSSPLYDPGPGQGLAGPIFEPAEPRRLWVAPWTDANGVVHSGEYMYFVTPGHWRYGPLRAPGAAAGVMSPVAPSELGFSPAPATRSPDDPDDIQQPFTSFNPRR